MAVRKEYRCLASDRTARVGCEGEKIPNPPLSTGHSHRGLLSDRAHTVQVKAGFSGWNPSYVCNPRVNRANPHECKRALPIHGGVAASFEVTQQWFHADNGVIEMPAAGDPIIASHAVHIRSDDDVMRKFTFANSWGPSWGRQGIRLLALNMPKITW